MAAKRFASTKAAYEAETVVVDEMYAASRDWKDSSCEVATGKAQRITALEAHRDRMKKLHDAIHVLYLQGARGGEAEKEYSSQFWVVEAEIWVREARR